MHATSLDRNALPDAARHPEHDAYDGLVTVVIAAYNPGVYLAESLRSVLEQTHRNIEIIVVDDGSTDESIDRAMGLLADPRVRLIRQANQGKPAAVNHAMSIATGNFLAMHDADDVSHPTRIERQAKALRDNPDLAAVFCGHELILHGRRVAPRFLGRTREQCRRDVDRLCMPALDPTLMLRRSAIGEARFDPTLRIGEGLDFILRIGEKSPMMVLGECLYSYRIHDASLTHANVQARLEAIDRVIEKTLARRGEPTPSPRNASGSAARSATNRDRDNNLVAHFTASVLSLKGARHYVRAIRTGMLCAGLHPLDPYYYKPILAGLLPHALLRRFRRDVAEARTP
ncbi:MAG: glycosyltransferase family A protein [Phycisphaerales bacterium]|jgi:glycosyltransferase involved in cell wall biosynthesis|nr:glycosyltransferase family A protein [Phycisphaerales bacterium]